MPRHDERPHSRCELDFAFDSPADRSECLVIVDDHAAIREALARLLGAGDLRILGLAGTAAAGRELVLRRPRRPDVAVIDIRLGDESGVELAEALLAELPGLGVLLYTGELVPPRAVDALFERGIRGVALKTGDAGELAGAIAQVAAGRSYRDRRLHHSPVGGPVDLVAALSEREREILRLVGRGLTNTQIADALFLSPHTVRTHVRNCLSKLGLHTRAEAVLALDRAESRTPGLTPR